MILVNSICGLYIYIYFLSIVERPLAIGSLVYTGHCSTTEQPFSHQIVFLLSRTPSAKPRAKMAILTGNMTVALTVMPVMMGPNPALGLSVTRRGLKPRGPGLERLLPQSLRPAVQFLRSRKIRLERAAKMPKTERSHDIQRSGRRPNLRRPRRPNRTRQTGSTPPLAKPVAAWRKFQWTWCGGA